MEDFVSLVHTVFNLGLNEPWEIDEKEYRNFHSVSYWKEHIEQFGFKDAGHRILQANDPSENTLLLFVKDELC